MFSYGLLSARLFCFCARRSNRFSTLPFILRSSATRARARTATLATMSGVGVLLSVAYGSKQLKTLNAASASSPVKKQRLSMTLVKVDTLFDENKMTEALAYLEPYGDSSEAEILWRLARLCYKVGKYHVADQMKARNMADRAVAYADRAIQADGQNFACHKWMGIILSWSSEFQGTRRKIERSFDIRDHFMKAIELNPDDATSRHLLGQWCYSIASVPWYQKKIATVVFARPPYSTYQEALKHFQAAEKIEPGFYSTNWLFIGKCYLQLGRVQEGGEWLKKAATHSSQDEEDMETKQEAAQLLTKLGIQ